MAEVLFCKTCGEMLERGWLYCPMCGEEVLSHWYQWNQVMKKSWTVLEQREDEVKLTRLEQLFDQLDELEAELDLFLDSGQ